MRSRVLHKIQRSQAASVALEKSSEMATTNLPLVLIMEGVPLASSQRQIIDSYSDKLTIVAMEDLTKDKYPKVEGMLTLSPNKNVSGTLIDSLPNLRIISTSSAGVDHINVEEANKRGIKIGFTPKVISDSTADLAFALLAASARNVVQGDAISKSPNTSDIDTDWYGVDISGSTIGIVGLGNIGSAVAQRAKGFSMKILYHTQTRKDALEKEMGVAYCHKLTDLLKQADFVVLCVPLTPQTKHLISAPELSVMKPSATLINIARGDVVNQDDLVKALQTGQIRAAALDVTSPEPLPRDHPLLTLTNVIITPHIGTATESTTIKMLTIAMDNLVAGLNGEPLLHQKY